MRGVLAQLKSFWHGLRKPAQVDTDMADEMRFHIEMEAQRLMTGQGLDAQEARRRAALAFGGVEKYRGAGRDALRFSWARGLSTDMKLGVRMLRKYPGLTAVAVFALSLAIGAGAAYLEFVNDMLHGQLPFPDAERIVGIQNWDQQTGDAENRSTFDFVTWRDRPVVARTHRRVPRARSQPDYRGRPRRTGARRGDQRVGVSHRGRGAGAGPAAAARGRARRCAAGRGAWTRRLGQSVRVRSQRDWPRRPSRQRTAHRRRRDARGVRVADQLTACGCRCH